MKLLPFIFLIGSLKYVPPKPEEPISNHDDLVARIEKKYLRGPDPIGFDEPTQHADISWIPLEMKQQAIDYLKEKEKNTEYLERVQKPLIALNDEETMLRVIKQFEDGTIKNLGDLEVNLNGTNIKYLVPLIYQGSSSPRDVGFGKMQSPRRQAIDLFIKPLVPSNGFSGPSVEWTGRLHYYTQKTGDDPHIMWLFQQWWEHNKNAVLAGKFAEATWVPMFKGQMDTFDPKMRNDPDYLNYTSTTRNDILEIPKVASIVLETKPAVPVTQPAPPAVSNTQKNSSIFIFLGLGLLVILTSVWAWVRHTKSP